MKLTPERLGEIEKQVEKSDPYKSTFLCGMMRELIAHIEAQELKIEQLESELAELEIPPDGAMLFEILQGAMQDEIDRLRGALTQIGTGSQPYYMCPMIARNVLGGDDAK